MFAFSLFFPAMNIVLVLQLHSLPLPLLHRVTMEHTKEHTSMIESQQMRAVKRLWETCKDYSVALQLNREFLRGRHPGTPYHLEWVTSDVIPLRDDLLHLHDFGFLTTGCQPGGHNEPVFLFQSPLLFTTTETSGM